MIKNTPDPSRTLVEEGQLRYCDTCACMHMHLPLRMGWKLCPLGHETTAVQYRIGAQGMRLVPEGV